MNLHDELYDATTFTDTVDGIRLANELIDRMIAVLQKTPGIPARSHHEWELLFAEARARAEQDFDDRLTGLVHWAHGEKNRHNGGACPLPDLAPSPSNSMQCWWR